MKPGPYTGTLSIPARLTRAQAPTRSPRPMINLAALPTHLTLPIAVFNLQEQEDS